MADEQNIPFSVARSYAPKAYDYTELTDDVRQNINKLAEAIKTKGYVVDMTEAISVAILLTYDTLALENNDAMAEVVRARGTEPTLKDRLGKMDDIDAEVTTQLAQKAEQHDLLVERNRIDQLTTLGEGSTTGDAELLDARVGADGVTYDNVGGAIRGQIDKLNNDLVEHKKDYEQPVPYNKLSLLEKIVNTNLLSKDGVLANSAMGTNGNVSSDENNGVSGFIPVEEGMELTFQATASGSRLIREMRTATAYDKNKNVIPDAGETSLQTKGNSYTVPANVAFVRLTMWVGDYLTDQDYYLSAVVNSTDVIPYRQPAYYKIKNDVRLSDNQIDALRAGGASHVDVTYGLGTIEDGIPVSYNVRFRSLTFFEVTNELFVRATNPNYQVIVVTYSVDGQYIETSQWADEHLIENTTGKMFRLIGKLKSNAPITEKDLTDNGILVMDGAQSAINTENVLRTKDAVAYIGNNKQLYYEKDGQEAYIKPLDAICFRGINLNINLFWEDVKQMLPSATFEASPTGIEDCLKIGVSHALCFNVATEELELISLTSVNIEHIVLFYNNYTSIGGRLSEHRIRNMVEAMKGLEDRINNTSGIPSYYEDEIVDTKNKLALLPKQNLNYIVITDIHNTNMPNSHCLSDELTALTSLANSSNIDFIVYLGDSIEGGVGKSTKEQAIKETSEIIALLSECKKPVFTAFGNHDNNCFNASSDVDTHYISMDEWENISLYPLGLYDGSYYYRDIPTKNTRVIVLNTSDYEVNVDENGNVTKTGTEISIRVEQLKWLATTLKETATDMLICGHGIPTALLDVLKAYQDRGSITLDGTVYDFSTNTNEILLYNFGHHHMDALEHSTTYNLNMMATVTGSMNASQIGSYAPNPILTSWTRPTARTIGTVLESAFDVVSIGEGKVNKIRFGAGEDDLLPM